MLCRSHFAIPCQAAQIVHTFKDDDPTDGRRRKHVAIEACQCIRPESVSQQMIAADALVGYPDVARRRGTLQPACKHVRPAIISIRRCTMTVGDGIAESDHCCCSRRSLHINLRDLIPVIHMLWLKERGRTHLVAMNVIRCRTRPRMRRLSRGRQQQTKGQCKV